MINESVVNKIDLRLKEEKLDITKKWLQTGEVTWHKEIINEEKNVVVPVSRQELVIEKKIIDPRNPNRFEDSEIIRIPISEERIEIIKHSVVLEEVEIYKREIEELNQINESVKKEILHIQTIDDPIVVFQES